MTIYKQATRDKYAIVQRPLTKFKTPAIVIGNWDGGPGQQILLPDANTTAQDRLKIAALMRKVGGSRSRDPGDKDSNE
jgi:hypothetical protein